MFFVLLYGGDMSKIELDKNELEKILKIMNELNFRSAYIEQDCSSGIGCSLEISFDTYINNIGGRFTIDLTEYENW
jgi:hypothetical protein